MFRRSSNGSCGLRFTQSTKCQQHLSKMCDVNNMIARAVAGDSSVYRHGQYGDYTSVPDDAQSMLNLGVKARQMFESLPDAVRAVYPSSEVFLAALQNPEEYSRLKSLGILQDVKAAEPIAVKVIADDVGNEGTKPEA